MSDLAPQFYDAFTDVHDNFPQQLFCTWHVDKAWKEQLKEKNLSQEYAICVYKGLRALLVEPIETASILNFPSLLKSFCLRRKQKSLVNIFIPCTEIKQKNGPIVIELVWA